MQGFLKSLLDVGDNLERAYGAVPPEALQGKDKDGGSLSTEKALSLLGGLVDGLKMTEKIFDQVPTSCHDSSSLIHLIWRTTECTAAAFVGIFVHGKGVKSYWLTSGQALKQHGVEKYRPEGDKFDPNLHEALFEMPDPSKQPGTVGAVTKVRMCNCIHRCEFKWHSSMKKSAAMWDTFASHNRQ